MPSAPSIMPDVLDHGEDDVVRGPPAAVADDDPGRDPLVAQAAFGRPVEDQLDGRGGRDRATQPADQRGGRRRASRSCDSA